MNNDLLHLPTFDEESHLHVIIETAKGSRGKFAFHPKTGLFRLRHILASGFAFPYDFGFIPSTLAEDGDPLDVLVLADADLFPGCLLTARLIGVIEAKQTNPGERKAKRNDRLIAVPVTPSPLEAIKELSDLPEKAVEQLEEFFVFYNVSRGRKFEPLARKNAAAARGLVEEGCKRFATK